MSNPNESRPHILRLLGVALALAISGCGGGDSTESEIRPGSPVFALQPQSLTVDEGQLATFVATASGDAPITYQWVRDGSPLAGATDTTFTLATSYADNGARLLLIATNPAGRTLSSEAVLSVTPLLPTVQTAPQSITAVAGATTIFSVVVAGGTTPITFQWQRNGVDIAGATNPSYMTPPLTSTDDGATYRVLVSNPAGTVTSASATLSVGSAFGQLTLSGPGGPAVGAANTYVPVTGAIAVANGPTCTGGSCISSLALRWSRGPGDQLYVQFTSLTSAAPGSVPGTDVNGVAITLASGVLGSSGLSYNCLAVSGCDLASLGITLDLAGRMVSFSRTALPNAAALGNPAVVLDGVLKY